MAFRKRRDRDTAPPALPAAAPPAPVNVVVVVESGRRRRSRNDEPQEKKGHPVLKTLLGIGVAKRLATRKRRKRPLSVRLAKATRKGRKRVTRAARKVRRKLR